MSHSHTHAPGEDHSHSHGPPTPIAPLTSLPEIQAAIDQDFVPVPLDLSPDRITAVCSAHKRDKCEDCGVDLTNTNRLSHLLASNPKLLCPPPSNVVSGKLTQMITSIKDEGNALFKAGRATQAITKYTQAAVFAAQRPPWEPHQFMRDELSTVISNRSAAYVEKQDYVSALADAEIVIAIRRNWGKGHIRKAKALLGLGRLREAADAVRRGLDFDPDSSELHNFLGDVERLEKLSEGVKLETRPAADQAIKV